MPLRCLAFPGPMAAPCEPGAGVFNHRELNFLREVSHWNQLGLVQNEVWLNTAEGTGAWLWVTAVSALAGASERSAGKPLPRNTKMAPMLGAAKYQAYNTCPEAVRLLLRVQKILINHWLFKLNHLELIWLMRKKKMNWTLLFSSTETYEISCSLESISVHTSLAPLCKIPYLCLISLSLIKATEFSIFC